MVVEAQDHLCKTNKTDTHEDTEDMCLTIEMDCNVSYEEEQYNCYSQRFQ